MEEIHLKGRTTLMVKCLKCGQIRPLNITVDNEKAEIHSKSGLMFQNDVTGYSNIDEKAMEEARRQIRRQAAAPLTENLGYNNFESM